MNFNEQNKDDLTISISQGKHFVFPCFHHTPRGGLKHVWYYWLWREPFVTDLMTVDRREHISRMSRSCGCSSSEEGYFWLTKWQSMLESTILHNGQTNGCKDAVIPQPSIMGKTRAKLWIFSWSIWKKNTPPLWVKKRQIFFTWVYEKILYAIAHSSIMGPYPYLYPSLS